MISVVSCRPRNGGCCRCGSSSTAARCASPASRAVVCARSPASAPRRESSAEGRALRGLVVGHLVEVTAGAVERAAGADEAPFGGVELVGQRGVGCGAVPVGHLGDAGAEVVELRPEAREEGKVAAGAHRRSLSRSNVDAVVAARIRRFPQGVDRYDAKFPRLARTDLRGASDVRRALARPPAAGEDVGAPVAAIVADVKARGDDALREYTQRFDRADLGALAVPRSESAAALDRLDPALRAALELARDQIVAWHEVQAGEAPVHVRSGVRIEEMVVPVDRAGCYVPGGRAPLASSVLMTALPARVAGVPHIALCTPPRADGTVHDAILAAAELAQVDVVYRVGGAQAIAALAYGTRTIAAVDVIVGPGNAYVAEAKRQVAADVAIDGYAGPSEVAIIADDTAPPVLVAADLLAQAEHGPGGACAVITWSES